MFASERMSVWASCVSPNSSSSNSFEIIMERFKFDFIISVLSIIRFYHGTIHIRFYHFNFGLLLYIWFWKIDDFRWVILIIEFLLRNGCFQIWCAIEIKIIRKVFSYICRFFFVIWTVFAFWKVKLHIPIISQIWPLHINFRWQNINIFIFDLFSV